MLDTYDMNTFHHDRDDDDDDDEVVDAIHARSSFLSTSSSRSRGESSSQSRQVAKQRLGMNTGKDGLARGYGGPSSVVDPSSGMEWEPSMPSVPAKRLRVDNESENHRWTSAAAGPSPFALFTQPKQVFMRAAAAQEASTSSKTHGFAPWGGGVSTAAGDPRAINAGSSVGHQDQADDDDEMMGTEKSGMEGVRVDEAGMREDRRRIEAGEEETAAAAAAGDVSMAISEGGAEDVVHVPTSAGPVGGAGQNELLQDDSTTRHDDQVRVS